ncbi:MAG: SidA/IucD/PvdA family monooxygenase, partial [Ilumatobacter sp.]|nr:SidA/IucD/PvdA family monooxygenase [Ilumatobacter sp.]
MANGTSLQHIDVLIVGAGLSGIGMACHLTSECPTKTYAIVEARRDLGGTWDLFRYPGIRSDSDMYTLGYDFKPWTSDIAIAPGAMIKDYIQEAAEEYDVLRHVTFGRRVVGASWDSDTSRWTVTLDHADDAGNPTGETETTTCNWLQMCSGYYSYSNPHRPEFPGQVDFAGQIVHPQEWPDDLDYAGKRVIVIGSGATAATLIPNMADDCEHITMLQRSPTYFATGRNVQELADTLRELDIDETWIHEITRRKIIFDGDARTRASAEYPDLVKAELFKGIREILGEAYD